MARILVIDDEALVRRLLRKMLEQPGHTLFDAPDGRKGMALWRRKQVNIVITDVFMTDKDGVEALIELKRSEERPKIIA